MRIVPMLMGKSEYVKPRPTEIASTITVGGEYTKR